MSLPTVLHDTFRRIRRRPESGVALAGAVAAGTAAVIAVWILAGGYGATPPGIEPTPEPGIALLDSAFPVASVQRGGLADLLRLAVGAAAGVFVIALLHAGVLAAGRERRAGSEMGIRSALGAPPRSIVVDRLTESLVLTGAGLATGLVPGVAGGFLLRGAWPQGFTGGTAPPSLPAWTVGIVAMAVLLPLLLALLSGVRGGYGKRTRARVVRGGGSVSDPAGRLQRGTLAALQIALSMTVLVVGISVLGTTLGDGEAPGMADAYRDTVTVRFDLAALDEESAAVGDLAPGLVAGARALRGVRSASISTPGTWFGLGPVAAVNTECGMCTDGGLFVPVTAPDVRHHGVAPGFFESAGLRMEAGRPFRAGDDADAPPVAVVSATYAARRFEDGNSLGRGVQIGGSMGPWHEVVGVVEDVRPVGPGGGALPAPAAYLPLAQVASRTVVLALRTDGRTAAVADEARGWLTAAGLDAGVVEISTLYAGWQRLTEPGRWFGRLVAVLGIFGLLLAAVGLRVVVRRNVEATRRELALRLAVGGPPGGLVRLVLRRTGTVLAWGVAAGILLAMEGAAQLQGARPELPIFDVPVVAVVVLTLTAAAGWGAWSPAREAASTEPGVILRERS